MIMRLVAPVSDILNTFHRFVVFGYRVEGIEVYDLPEIKLTIACKVYCCTSIYCPNIR